MTVRYATSIVIRGMRGEKRISQGQLAKRARLSRQQISFIERGLVTIKLDTIFNIATAFDMTGDELVRRIGLIYYGWRD